MADGDGVAEIVAGSGGGATGDMFADLERVIAQAEAEGITAEVVADVPAVVPAPAVVAEVAPATVTPPVVEAAKIEPKPEVRAEDTRALTRLAEREAAVAELEKKNRALASQFRRNPVEALKAVGLDEAEVGQVIRAAMATQLPADKVPPQYKEIQARLAQEDRFRAQESELQKLRSELDLKDQTARQQAAVAQYTTEARTYLGGAETEAPHLSRMFKAAPDKALRRVLDVVAADATAKMERANRGENVLPMTPAEAAKAVEAELAEYAQILGVGNASIDPAKTAAKGKPSLSNRATQPASARVTMGDRVNFDAEAEVDGWLKSQGL